MATTNAFLSHTTVSKATPTQARGLGATLTTAKTERKRANKTWTCWAMKRRESVVGMTVAATVGMMATMTRDAKASLEEDYAKETKEVIEKVRNTVDMDRTDPKIAEAVTSLRQMSNEWVAKYRRENSLAGKPSFSNMYSVLNAVSGHYISFGPSAPIPSKRKARIFEEMDIAEKALSRGR